MFGNLKIFIGKLISEYFFGFIFLLYFKIREWIKYYLIDCEMLDIYEYVFYIWYDSIILNIVNIGVKSMWS